MNFLIPHLDRFREERNSHVAKIWCPPCTSHSRPLIVIVARQYPGKHRTRSLWVSLSPKGIEWLGTFYVNESGVSARAPQS